MSDKPNNKKTFEATVGDKVLQLAVVRPTNKVAQTGTVVYNRAMREAVAPSDGKPGALVRQKVETVLREQNLWDDKKQARYDELVKALLDGEKKLAKGGIKMSEARTVAMGMRRTRAELRLLNAERNELDAITAEAQAEQARFNYYVAACTVYADTGKPYFADVDDYLGRADDPVVPLAASAMGKLIYGLEDNYELKLPESKFLVKHKFADEKLRLIDRNGNLVDEKGRRVDEEGRYIDEKGEFVDSEGNPLTADGQYKVEFVDFIDDISDPADPPKDEAVAA